MCKRCVGINGQPSSSVPQDFTSDCIRNEIRGLQQELRFLRAQVRRVYEGELDEWRVGVEE